MSARIAPQTGLLTAKGKAPLPLKDVSVRADVNGYVLGLRSTLTYSNDSSDPVEVLFRFPLEKSHAVVGLTALIDGRKIRADVREKEEARARYDDAIASGRSAALAEEKSGDIFSVTLGNLPPGKDAQIELQVVGELSIDAEGGVRFSLPSTLKPRYTPAGSTDPLAGVPSGEGQQVESASIPAVSWFHMTVEGAEGIAEVTSPTHSITATPKEGNRLDVSLSEEKALSGDLVILLKHKEPHVPKGVVEGGVKGEGGGEFMSSPAVMINFYPQFTEVEAACEFVFLVDRSGSMSGSYIRSARETLVLFLKSLPEGSYFNILGFGSSYKKLFPDSVPYDERHLDKAIQHAQSMEADLGGTELLPPLKYIFGEKCRSGYPRQIFVLTDGSVSNTNACIQQMKQNVKSARCFTFGIGSGASTALVEGLARAGNGTAEFVKEGERMQPKVIRSLKRALQPAITDVSVQFKVPKEYQVLQSPQNFPPVFNGEKLVVYGILQSKAASKKEKRVDCTAILKGNVLGKSQEHKVSFILDSAEAPNLPTIHHLAAKALITDWEGEGKDKKSIVELSVEASVISSHTAFIAVDEESSEPVAGAMKTYDIKARGEWSDNSSCSASSLLSSDYDEEDEEEDNEMPMLATNQEENLALNISRRRALVRDLSEEEEKEMEAKPLKGRKNKKAPKRAAEEDYFCEGELEYELASWSEGEGQERVLQQRREKADIQAAADKAAGLTALTNLITAQQVNGSWALNSALARQVGKSLSDLESACPTECKGAVASVWATVLAVSLLRARYSSQQDEWELIAMKAESWLKKQSLPSGVSLEQLFQAAQKTLA